MGDAHCQPAADATPERRDACLELFRPGYHRQDYADVLHRRYIDVIGFLEHPEKDWEVALEEVTGSSPAEK